MMSWSAALTSALKSALASVKAESELKPDPDDGGVLAAVVVHAVLNQRCILLADGAMRLPRILLLQTARMLLTGQAPPCGVKNDTGAAALLLSTTLKLISLLTIMRLRLLWHNDDVIVDSARDAENIEVAHGCDAHPSPEPSLLACVAAPTTTFFPMKNIMTVWLACLLPACLPACLPAYLLAGCLRGYVATHTRKYKGC